MKDTDLLDPWIEGYLSYLGDALIGREAFSGVSLYFLTRTRIASKPAQI